MEDTIGGSTHTVVGKQLDDLEAKVDTTLENTLHEVRQETKKVADQAFNRWKHYWGEQSPKIEAYIAAHPWLVLGGLVILGYMFSHTQRTRPPRGATTAR